MPEHMRMFLDFVVEGALLENDVYQHLLVFRAFLVSADAHYPGSVSKLGQAMLQLTAAPLRVNEDIVIDSLREKKEQELLQKEYDSAMNRYRKRKTLYDQNGGRPKRVKKTT